MGVAETIPGVSGGTIALMTGVYETILSSAGHLISGVRIGVLDLVRGRGVARAREPLGAVRWDVMVPLVIGMFAALITAARVMEGLVESHPETMRGLFFGLVLASLVVPYRLAAHSVHARLPTGRWGAYDVVIALIAAIVAYVIVSLPRGDLVASPWVLVPAGAIAVTALVLPGLSGSFLLLAMGLYEPTLAAVNDRDWGYVGYFALGGLIGLVSIVKALEWLLDHRRRVTLVVLTGVMAGSLRALWPWTNDENQALAPSGPVALPVIAALVGVITVLAVIAVEKRLADRAGVLDSEVLDAEALEDDEALDASDELGGAPAS
jgi:putative membrane protein